MEFCDNFWGDKHQGFDVLYQNMKTGAKTSGEFLDILREIYSMEDSCTKSWNKLSKQINVNSSGSLQPFWQPLKELSEKYSTLHMEYSQNIQLIIKSVQKYIEEQQAKQKSIKETDLQNINNLLVTTQSQLIRAKDVYHSRYLEFHKLHKLDQNNGNRSRDMERMETKLKKAFDDYKYVIDRYNNTCTQFKLKMKESCKKFQEIETFHLEQMKDFVNRFSNCLFKAQSDLNAQGIEFERTQAKLTVQTLFELFLKSKSTGKIPPEGVTFEDAIEAKTSDSNSLNDSSLNGNYNGDAVTGNLVNIDSSSDVSSTHVSNINLTPNAKDSMNDLLDQISNVSDNNSINHTTIVNDSNNIPTTTKKQKKINIFRRKRNSPSNGVNQKPLQDIDKDKSSHSLGEYLVDEEGFTIKPNDPWADHNQNSSTDSSSDDDGGDNIFKGIKIEIKPQESKSDSSSIPDTDMPSKNKLKNNDNLELFKAVQAFKISPNIFRDTPRRTGDSRSNTPSLPSYSNENSGSQISIRDSRRKKNSRSQSEQMSSLAQPYFQVEFTNSFESNGLDLAGITPDSFSSRFESIQNPTSELPQKAVDNKNDPWSHSIVDKPTQPPPLPVKFVPPRAASTVPFTHSTIESKRLGSVPPSVIPATPLRLPINTIEGIPLAIAFTETVNAKFRESFSTTPHDVHTSGQLVISFPCSMLQQFESIGENQLNLAEPIHFCLTQASRLRNVEPLPTNKDINIQIENPTDDSYSIFIDLLTLHKKLMSLRRNEPASPFFNIDIVRYDVTNNVRPNGNITAPVHISANWQITDALSSHLMISYNLQWPNTEVGSLTFRPSPIKSGNSEVRPHGEVRFLVVADGNPSKMQSLPPSIWNCELGRASWRLDLSTNTSSIKSKFILSNGPGTPQPVVCQFSAEGSIESGVLLQVTGNRFRISRHKYRLISGRYVWEPSTNATGFCV